MGLFRYSAVPIGAAGTTATGGAAAGGTAAGGTAAGRTNGTPSARRALSGELAGETGAEVRQQLRKIGLQVLELEPVKAPTAAVGALQQTFALHLRTRRRGIRAELFDSLATMLESGMPLLEALDGVRTAERRSSRVTTLLMHLRTAIQGGKPLDRALAEHATWFDPIEVALVEAGQRSGTLPDVLRRLSDRHAKSGETTAKLAAALAYPALVTVLGIAVVVFLSVKTLPELVQVLRDAQLEPPALTRRVMAFGTFVAGSWGWILIAVLGLLAGFVWIRARGIATGGRVAELLDRMRPRIVRDLKIGGFAQGFAELIETGVPIVEALRVLAPSAAPPLARSLRATADAIERGTRVADAFSDPAWFTLEFRRSLEVGQTTGELPALLRRIGARLERKSSRAIDRLAALLEPAAILLLAFLVGTVALSAVLPLFQLQEVLK